jgi:hypothetical protein
MSDEGELFAPDNVIAHAFWLHFRQRFRYLARYSGINKNKQK